MKKIKVFIITVFIITISCGTSREAKDLDINYKKYLISRDISPEKVSDSHYFKDFILWEQEQKKKHLSFNMYLKTNKVYVYQEGSKKNTFCVFSDDGSEYLARIYKADSLFLTKPENGVVKLKQALKLAFLGDFELTDTIIKISRNIRELSGKEFNECDVGILQKDTIRLVENYDTKKYSYKKKWLTKTYRTNYKLVYQPNLKAIRYEGDENHNPYYLIEGSFREERDLVQEKVLELIDKVKY